MTADVDDDDDDVDDDDDDNEERVKECRGLRVPKKEPGAAWEVKTRVSKDDDEDEDDDDDDVEEKAPPSWPPILASGHSNFHSYSGTA